MQLEWTAALRDVAKQRHAISVEFLQPYQTAGGGAVCSRYLTCLACMTDTACGWCSGNNNQHCVDRITDNCHDDDDDDDDDDVSSFIINAQYCPVCADHITCYSCLQVHTPL